MEETLSTLKYADRAKHIKNKPVVNVDSNTALIQSLREELQAAKREIVILRDGHDLPGSFISQQK